jgi:hypothetical protein
MTSSGKSEGSLAPSDTDKGAAAHSPLDSSQASLTPDLERDALVLPRVPEYLARGLALKRWWSEIERDGGPKETFDIVRSFNQPTRSFGFFGEAPIDGKMTPVLGNVQEMFYDQVRAPVGLERKSADWTLAQMREFVMKYFLRITSFRQTEAYSDAADPVPPPALARLSWCPRPTPTQAGFGFAQLFNKPVGSSVAYPFPGYERHAIVDQREIGALYDWIVLKVRIFDFNFNFRPFGDRGPELVFSENEESYLVAHEEFINHKDYSGSVKAAALFPVGHVKAIGEYGAGDFVPIGDYGVGYAFIRNPVQSIFGYGPGEFDAAIQLINFRIYDTGYVSVRMVFIANRPQQIANLTIDPIDWGFRIADGLSFGLASRLLAPAKGILGQLPLKVAVDPVSAYIDLTNLISGGAAGRTLCITKETLSRYFLLMHFQQHYQTLLGTLSTWRQFDWLDPKSLPPWIISGVNS